MSCQIKEEERETYVLTWPRGARRRGRGRDGPGSEVPATDERGQCAGAVARDQITHWRRGISEASPFCFVTTRFSGSPYERGIPFAATTNGKVGCIGKCHVRAYVT